MPDVRQGWDELAELDRAISEASGERPAAGERWGLDPSLAATVRAVAAFHRTPRPSPEFAARLENRLALAADVPSRITRVRQHGAPPPAQPVRRPAIPLPALPVRRMASYVSLAILLLVMLGGIWLTIEHGRSNQADQPADVSAEISGPLPATAEGAAFVLRRLTLAPGALYTDIQRGPTFLFVEQGTVRFRSLLDRDDRTLGPAEMATASYDSTIIVDNNSEEPAALLIAAIHPSINAQRPFMNPGATIVTTASGALGIDFADGAKVRLHRATLGRGDRSNPWQTAGPAWIVVDQGRLGLTLTGKLQPFAFESGVERDRPAGEAIPLPAGVSVNARNAGDDPLVLIILTVEPVSSAAVAT